MLEISISKLKKGPDPPPPIPNHTKGGVGGRYRRRYEDVLEEGRGQRVPRSRGPKNQDISKSYSNMSLTLKKVYLVSGTEM